MKPAKSIFAFLALAVAVGTSGEAHPTKTMNHSSMSSMKMSAADMNMMMSCKRMSKTAMMKNKRCANMMKMHPDMMKMSSMEMKKMSSCMKMSNKAMMADKGCASIMAMHHKKMMTH